MVLLELGQKIKSAINNFGKSTVSNEAALKKCLNEIVAALLQADVNFKIVKAIKESIETQFKLHESTGSNMSKLVEKLVVEELTRMLDPHKKPYVMKKGKPNVVMFVGLQGSGKTTT